MSTFEIIFSPTGGTEKVVKIISENLNNDIIKVDLCDFGADFAKCKIRSDDIAVIAIPSFGGRAPAVAVKRLKQIKGNGAECVLVCVYGNRAYEDTLAEMEDAVKESGFKVKAAIAAVAQHSIFPQYATNRPDEDDEKQLASFALKIKNSNNTFPKIPGNRPYKKAGGKGNVPMPTKECISCGICAESCPVQAIDYKTFKADAEKCISCMRCVKYCSNKSRVIDKQAAAIVADAIKVACSERKENELFL